MHFAFAKINLWIHLDWDSPWLVSFKEKIEYTTGVLLIINSMDR